MKLLILDENYPHEGNLMGDVFVHVRAKEYAVKHQVKAFSFFQEPSEIIYEGISLQRFNDLDLLAAAVQQFSPDRILIHFYQSWMLEKIIKTVKVPVIIWVHGYEALGWYRRLFNYTLYSPVFFKFILKNTRQQYHLRKLIRFANQSRRVRFIFVSEWMKKLTVQDALTPIRQFDIIPNPIDTELFKYREKDKMFRSKVLLLRSFGSRKYANDIAVNAILKLSEKKIFSEFSFTIVGDGGLFEKTLAPLRKFSNIEIKKGAVRQMMIPALHKEHGIFLCPTRQDAQGVSMCEAMSSGLVPVTSDTTAIPEFVQHNESGVLTRSAGEITSALEDLYLHPEKFTKLSNTAAGSIKQKCNIKIISKRELDIIES